MTAEEDEDATAADAAAAAGASVSALSSGGSSTEAEDRLRRLCLDLSCAGAHMRRGDAELADPLYRRVLAELESAADDSADRLAFYVEARLGLAEIDLSRLRSADSQIALSDGGGDSGAAASAASATSATAAHQRCRHLLRALSHAHAAEDALGVGSGADCGAGGRSGASRRLQLRLLRGSVQVKRRLLESRLQGLLRRAMAAAGPSPNDRGAAVAPAARQRSRRRRHNSNSFYNERPFLKRSPSLQPPSDGDGGGGGGERRRRQRHPPQPSAVATFVRQLRDYLVRCAADTQAAIAAAAAAIATGTEVTAVARAPSFGHRHLERQNQTNRPEQMSFQQLDSLIGRFVRDGLQTLKDSRAVPRDLVISSLRRDESGQHYLQYSRQYLSFAQSLASSPRLREEMEAAASGLMGDIRRDQLEKALIGRQRADMTATTLPVTGQERAAARLAARLRVPANEAVAQQPCHAPDDVAAMLKTLLRSLLDIAKAAFDSDQLEEAADLFDTCLDLCRSLTRELGDTEVEGFEVPKIHRLLGIIHCRLGDRRRGVSEMTFAAELFEKRLKADSRATPRATSADSGEDDSQSETDTDAQTAGKVAALGLAETWYDIGCVLLGCDADGRCGDLVLASLSDALKRRCIADILQLAAENEELLPSQLPPPAQAADALKAFERCRALLRVWWQRQDRCHQRGQRRRQRGPRSKASRSGVASDSQKDVEVRVTSRLADCCFAAGDWERALGHYEEALALLGDGGAVDGGSGRGGGRVIDHGHVLRMLGSVRLLLLDNSSQAAAVLETSLIMFQHLRKVAEATDGEAGWDAEKLWVLAPLLICHLAEGHHPRALHCARAVLNSAPAASGGWVVNFFANLAAGLAAKRLRDPPTATRHLHAAAAAAASGTVTGSPTIDRLLACVVEAEAAGLVVAEADAERAAGHYRRLLDHLAIAAAGRQVLRCPAVAAACLRGAEFFHEIGRPDASHELLEAHVRCSPVDTRLDTQLGLALGTAAMRCGQWDRALAYLKGALSACARRNPDGDVGPEGAPILRCLGTLHHVRFCQERRDILFEHADVQELQDRCAFNYLQSLELRPHPDCALRLAGFLLATDQPAEAERFAELPVDDDLDAGDGCLEFLEFEAPTLHWGLDAVWPALPPPRPAVMRLRGRALSSALLACCSSHRRDITASPSVVLGHLRGMLASVASQDAGPDDRLFGALVLLHHGFSLEAALLLLHPPPKAAASDGANNAPNFLAVWCSDLALAGLAVAMVTALCCLLHLTNALARSGSSSGGANSRPDDTGDQECTRL